MSKKKKNSIKNKNIEEAQIEYEKEIEKKRKIKQQHDNKYRVDNREFKANRFKTKEIINEISQEQRRDTSFSDNRDKPKENASNIYESSVNQSRGVEQHSSNRYEDASTVRYDDDSRSNKGNYSKTESGPFDYKPPKFDYTNNGNVQEAQKTYESSVNQSRGVKQHSSNRYEDASTARYDDDSPSNKGNYSKTESGPFDYKPPKFNYTNNSNVQEAQKTYESSVNQSRGVEQHSSNRYEDASTARYDDDSPSNKGNYSKTEGGPFDYKPPKFDYTNNGNVQEAQKTYESSVNQSRGIKQLNESVKNGFIIGEGPNKGKNITMEGESLSEDFTQKSNLDGVNFLSKINIYRNVDAEKLVSGYKIDLSELYEESAKGGAEEESLSKLIGASEGDLKNLLNRRDIKYEANKTYKFVNTSLRGVSVAKTYLLENTTGSSDVGQGLRIVTSKGGLVYHALRTSALSSAHKAMLENLPIKLNDLSKDAFTVNDAKFIGNVNYGLTGIELRELENELKGKLLEAGHQNFTGSGLTLQKQLLRFLKKNKEVLDKNEVAVVEMLLEISKANIVEEELVHGKKLLRMRTFLSVMRYVQQADAGYGAKFIYNTIRRGKMLVKAGIKAFVGLKNTAVKIAHITKLTDLIRSLREKLSKLTDKSNVRSKLQNVMPARDTSERRPDILPGREEKKPSVFNKNKERKAEKQQKKLVRKLSKRKPERKTSFISKAKANLGKKFADFKVFDLGFKTMLLKIGALMTGSVFFLCIVMYLFEILFGSFDLSSTDEKRQEEIFEQIEACYNQQNDAIKNLYKQYNNVQITYIDKRNEEAYALEEHKPDSPIVQTTNAAELLCMATIYFDFDIESPDAREVKQYIKELYYGSHVLDIKTIPIYETDAEGNTKLVDKRAEATLTTYYFDELFNCKLTSSPITQGATGIISGTEITEKVWNYLRTAGVDPIQAAGIMGNIYGESGFDPALVEKGNGIGFGLCQWSFGRRTALENFAKSKGKPASDLQVQLDFLMTELNRSHFNSYYTGVDNYSAFMNATTTDDATYYFMWGWERPSREAGEGSMSKRQSAAASYYAQYKDKELVTEDGGAT